jgi:hypothetical protein
MKEEPKEIVKKVLSSGLIDRGTALMMERMGLLPSGAVDLVQEDKLKGATVEVLTQMAEELGDAVEKEHIIRETALDLERIRWPALLTIKNGDLDVIVPELSCVMDRMGRYYIRVEDAEKAWFVPGFVVERKMDADRIRSEYITESGVLYIGEKPVCYQLTTKVLTED